MTRQRPHPLLCFALLLPVLLRAQDPPQSLADAARKEAERRSALDAQGVQAKVITGAGAGNRASGAAVKPQSTQRSPAVETQRGPKESRSLRAYRNDLERLDRQIRDETDRLSVLRSRAESVRKESALRLRRPSSRDGRTADETARSQILLLEKKIARLREDRLRTYDAGRRAGFLPGELEGKGIFP